MILDSLVNGHRYLGLGEGIATGLQYLASLDPALEPGRYPIDGDRVFALVQTYETGPATEKRFESHRLHLDIQYVVTGRERILHAPATGLQVDTPYAEAKDVVFYQDPSASSSFLLLPGDFAIFFPADGHKPGCMAGARDPVRKVVVKIRI